MRRTLTEDNATFTHVKRGLLIEETNEHSNTLYYVPRSSSMHISSLGENTTVVFGKRTLTLTMPHSMWQEHGDDIIRAAMGEDVL